MAGVHCKQIISHEDMQFTLALKLMKKKVAPPTGRDTAPWGTVHPMRVPDCLVDTYVFEIGGAWSTGLFL